jgi:hypothetical protein
VGEKAKGSKLKGERIEDRGLRDKLTADPWPLLPIIGDD